jgi:phage N-6-adenine-methyltransferase
MEVNVELLGSCAANAPAALHHRPDLVVTEAQTRSGAALARRIQAAHEAAQASARTALESAILCGELLLEAKRLVGHGRFLPWLDENTTLGPRQAQRYMRVARNQDALRNASSETHLAGAMALLADAKGEPAPLPWSGAVEWYTPPEFIEAARQVMGGIDLDPASNDLAQEVVRASTYHTAETDGLAQEWTGRVWLNPPYAAGEIDRFISKLVAEHTAGRVTEAVLLVHSRTDTAWFHEAASAAAICFTRGRVRFQRPDGSGDAPPIGSAFLYFGDNPGRFVAAFGSMGLVFFNHASAAPARPIGFEMAA